MSATNTTSPGRAALAEKLPDPVEIRTIARMIEDLDYYQVRKVEPGAALGTIRAAYHEQSRIFHPDRYLSVDDDSLRRAVNDVAKRIKEAYSVLRHPVKRRQYNLVLQDGSRREKGLRFTQATAVAAQRAREEAVGKTPKGREFIRMAEEERRKGNFAAALRNVKMALVYEPGNPRFVALQQEIGQSQRGIKNS